MNASFTEVLTDEGITRYGLPVDEHLLQTAIAPYLLGADLFAIERNARVLRNAGGGWVLEIALWDIIGKACGQPLYKLWGSHKDRVRAYSSCMEVRSGERRGRGRSPPPRGGPAGHQAPHPRLDHRRGRAPGGEGA